MLFWNVSKVQSPAAHAHLWVIERINHTDTDFATYRVLNFRYISICNCFNKESYFAWEKFNHATCYRAIMPYISLRDSLPGARPIFPRARDANERCFESDEGRTKEERTYSKKDRIACGANKRRFASAYNERKEGQPNAYTLTPLLYSSLTLRAFAFAIRSSPPTPRRVAKKSL